LLSICTHPDYSGRGIGKALMEAFRAESQARGYKTMRLSAHLGNNPAIALYKKCGWEVILETSRGIYFRRKVEK
jgi:ribosomal protein S18 acetylase RimI-like enzyme